MVINNEIISQYEIKPRQYMNQRFIAKSKRYIAYYTVARSLILLRKGAFIGYSPKARRFYIVPTDKSWTRRNGLESRPIKNEVALELIDCGDIILGKSLPVVITELAYYPKTIGEFLTAHYLNTWPAGLYYYPIVFDLKEGGVY